MKFRQKMTATGSWSTGSGQEVFRKKPLNWMKEITPSTELRKWFDHDPEKFAKFKKRYGSELVEKQEPIEKLLDLAAEQTLTLLYAAKDETHNHAIVLKEFLERYG